MLADPRAGAALRGLRRLARGAGDLSEATRLLEVELQIAGPLERRALGLHRVDLLMAAGEQDLARVSVGELIDQAQGDVRAQLAQLELAFLDGRAAELDEALVRLAAALTDPALRAATQIARGHLAERGADGDRARAAFEAASQADPGAIAAWLGGLRVTAPTGWTPLVAEVERQHGDRTVTAAIGLRAAAGGGPAAGASATAAAASACGTTSVRSSNGATTATVAGDALGVRVSEPNSSSMTSWTSLATSVGLATGAPSTTSTITGRLTTTGVGGTTIAPD